MARHKHVKLIVAIGNFGQIGNRGQLPWHDPDDLAMFKAVTMGGLCIVGKATFATLPDLPGRDVVVWKRGVSPDEFALAHSDRQIWVCGGRSIYREWLPHVSTSIVSHIDFDPKCDRYMPWLWKLPVLRKPVKDHP